MPMNMRRKNRAPKTVRDRLRIRAADDNLVPAVFVSNGSDKLVILSHGISTGKEEDGIYTEFAENVLSPSFDSVRFDFRGHGESAMDSRQVTVAGEILDFMAVVRWARERHYSKLFHLGTSFGASITLLSVSSFDLRDFSAVVFWNPVISYRNTFICASVPWGREFFNQKSTVELAYRKGTRIPETDFTIGPCMTMELLNLHPEAAAWPIGVPLLVIHGDRDTCVPHSDAHDYCARNRGARLLTLKGVDHGFDDSISCAYRETLEWFTRNA